MLFIISFSIVILDIIGIKNNLIGNNSFYLLSRNSIFAILFSISIFNFFINFNQKNNNVINSISKYVLGVYLISDNYLIRKYLWTSIFNVSKYAKTNYLLIHMILCIFIVFVVCILIDFIRYNSVEKLNTYIIEKLMRRKKVE